jgi:glycerophosphoryl diester phosphodiesterase
VDDEAEVARLSRLGVAAIITNRPAAVVASVRAADQR